MKANLEYEAHREACPDCGGVDKHNRGAVFTSYHRCKEGQKLVRAAEKERKESQVTK